MRFSESQKSLPPATTLEQHRFRHLLSPSSVDFGRAYGPESLSAIQLAFDQAWAVVGRNYAPADIEMARGRLAKSLLSVAHDNGRDIEWLKREALQAMALSYRYPFSGPSKRSRATRTIKEN